MAYMRGHYYLWADSEDWIHIWSADGYDAWDNSGWAIDENDQRWEGKEHASGVSVPHDVMDQYVLMRLARLICEGKVEEVIDKFLSPEGQRGNFGADFLEQNAEKLKHALSQIKLDPPKPR